jgi:hypothetical protein
VFAGIDNAIKLVIGQSLVFLGNSLWNSYLSILNHEVTGLVILVSEKLLKQSVFLDTNSSDSFKLISILSSTFVRVTNNVQPDTKSIWVEEQAKEKEYWQLGIHCQILLKLKISKNFQSRERKVKIKIF